jgi:hypothetical protein
MYWRIMHTYAQHNCDVCITVAFTGSFISRVRRPTERNRDLIDHIFPLLLKPDES